MARGLLTLAGDPGQSTATGRPRPTTPTRLLLGSLLALAACPTSAPGLLERADELEARQQYTKAQQSYRDALRRLGDGEDQGARALRARALAHLADLCYLDLRDLRCATDNYHKLIEGYPEAPETFQARTHFAEMLRDRVGDLSGAIAQFKALAQAYPDRAGADDFQYQAAQGYFVLRDYPQARAEVRTLLERFPKSPRTDQARFLLVSCYELEGAHTEAEEALRELIAASPKGELAPKARIELAKLFERDGHIGDAMTLLAMPGGGPSDVQEARRELQRLKREIASARALAQRPAFDDAPVPGERRASRRTLGEPAIDEASVGGRE
jgi:TolA-binding protein